ncbi:hypothetical protein QTP88_024207 [Uroleucon formosanum]
MTGSAKGESVFIPRIPMIPSDYPFQFKRMQFPVKCKPPESFWNDMNWMVIIFSSLLLLEMKFRLHTMHLKPKDSLISGVTPVHPKPRSSNHHFSQKNHGISVLGPQRHHID